jgi:hypothetical protein
MLRSYFYTYNSRTNSGGHNASLYIVTSQLSLYADNTRTAAGPTTLDSEDQISRSVQRGSLSSFGYVVSPVSLIAVSDTHCVYLLAHLVTVEDQHVCLCLFIVQV